jgi:dipeptidyl aminopeptidase/acylaminoacyl peptidase
MSPDGSILLLLRDWTGADNKGHIDLYSVELKSHQEKRVAKDVSGAGYFSPNGDTIAYTAQTGDSGQVIIMDAKRGVPIRRLTPAVNETCHGYSLNGRFLAITEGPLETRSAAIVDTFSSKERWLSAEIPASMAGLQAAVQPSGWSPDGHHLLLRVAFHEEMPAFAGGECLEISDLDNGRCRVLGLSIDKGAFSKDGSHIIALDRRRRIIVIDPRHPDRRQTLAAGVSGFAVR